MAYFNPSVYLPTKINVKEGMACYSLCLVCDIESNEERDAGNENANFGMGCGTALP